MATTPVSRPRRVWSRSASRRTIDCRRRRRSTTDATTASSRRGGPACRAASTFRRSLAASRPGGAIDLVAALAFAADLEQLALQPRSTRVRGLLDAGGRRVRTSRDPGRSEDAAAAGRAQGAGVVLGERAARPRRREMPTSRRPPPARRGRAPGPPEIARQPELGGAPDDLARRVGFEVVPVIGRWVLS